VSDTAWFTYDDFAGHVGEEFLVAPAGEELALTLVEVTTGPEPGGTGPEGTSRQQFSLVFRGPRQPVLDQAIHELRHATMTGLDLFLVPLGPDGDGMRYEAAFA
jgi:hypothetical protein